MQKLLVRARTCLAACFPVCVRACIDCVAWYVRTYRSTYTGVSECFDLFACRDELTNHRQHQHQHLTSLQHQTFCEARVGSTSTSLAVLQTSHSSAKALRFARSIVLGSTRTISGGDAYDAVDLLFRNRDLVILCPLAGRESRVEIELRPVHPVLDEPARPTSPSSGTSPGGFLGASPAATAAPGSNKISRRKSFRSPPRPNLAPSVKKKAEAQLWPAVDVTSRTFYRLRDCDGGDDVAVAEAVFRRKFLCDGSTNGSITVVLHSADEVGWPDGLSVDVLFACSVCRAFGWWRVDSSTVQLLMMFPHGGCCPT